VLRPVDSESAPVEREPTLLLVALKPVDKEPTLLLVALRPVDRESTPVESEPT
jgi:hypothetical protein